MKIQPNEWPEWFDLLEEGVAFVDNSGCFIRVNSGLAELLGYAPSELCGKSLRLITHPDDVIVNENELKKVVNGEINHYALLKRYITKYGNSIWVKVITHPIKSGDKIEHLFKQVITIKNGAREQIRKVNNEVQIYETLTIDGFIRKNWTRLVQVFGVVFITIAGWTFNTTAKMYADSNRLDRLEQILLQEKENEHAIPRKK